MHLRGGETAETPGLLYQLGLPPNVFLGPNFGAVLLFRLGGVNNV